MINNILLKTLTEVSSDGSFFINGFIEETSPSIYKAQILQEKKVIDNIEGKEGELMISSKNDTDEKLDDDGNLIIDSPDSEKYSKGGEDNANLLYEE